MVDMVIDGGRCSWMALNASHRNVSCSKSLVSLLEVHKFDLVL